ncbi:MAG: hypothetical protein AAGA54_32530 [Myxococcota bacterium]
MNEDEMLNLWGELEGLRSVFEAFASASGYETAEPRAMGRYPTIRLTQRAGDLSRWIQCGMGLDPQGRRLQRLSPRVSYELGGGAFVDRVDAGCVTRHSRRHLVFEGLKIETVRARVTSDLFTLHESISAWTLDDVLSEGESFPIEGRSKG